jgi:hypothetical protein
MKPDYKRVSIYVYNEDIDDDDEWIIDFNYYPGEKAYFNYREGYGNPEVHAEIEIVRFEKDGEEIKHEDISDSVVEELEQGAWDYFNKLIDG